MALSASGTTVWFADRSNEKDRRLFSYDVASARSTAYQVDYGVTYSGSRTHRWELNQQQVPAYFEYDFIPTTEYSRGDEVFDVLEPTGKPPPSGGEWLLKRTLRSKRPAAIDLQVQIQGVPSFSPVRWRSRNSLWVEDFAGIAELDIKTGRTVRAFALPQRFGWPKRFDVRGQAPWVPDSLGSKEANWIATGFVLLLADDGKMPPKYELRSDAVVAQNTRFVGMHVTDIKTGRNRMTALLGQSNSLETAARSANGKLLALGSNGVSGSGPIVAIWDVANMRALLRLVTPGKASLRALAFSWDGADLWGLTHTGLLRWHIPEELQDAAKTGSFPEQSVN